MLGEGMPGAGLSADSTTDGVCHRLGRHGVYACQVQRMQLLAVVLVCTLIALLPGILLYTVLARVMTRYDSSMSELDYEPAGQLGYISIAAADGAVGEMKYVLHGTMRSIGVRAESGQSLLRGDRVIIVKTDKGIAAVTLFEREMEHN